MTEDLCVRLVPLFQGLDIVKQREIEQLVHHKHTENHELIVSPNDPNRLVIVASGSARMYTLDSSGNEHITQSIKTGDYVGESWLLGSDNPNNFVETTSKSDICIINQTDFMQLLDKNPEITHKLLKGQAELITALRRQNYLLGISNISDRITTYLHQLYLQQGGKNIKLPLALKDVASYLGTTPETLSRKLNALEKKGHIKYHLRHIQIIKPFAL